jgi:hypothetical protein
MSDYSSRFINKLFVFISINELATLGLSVFRTHDGFLRKKKVTPLSYVFPKKNRSFVFLV